jgi:hypothetical protein
MRQVADRVCKIVRNIRAQRQLINLLRFLSGSSQFPGDGCRTLAKVQRVWERITEIGHRHAEQKRVLTEDQAREIVLSICDELHVGRPEDEVLAYMSYALARRTR